MWWGIIGLILFVATLQYTMKRFLIKLSFATINSSQFRKKTVQHLYTLIFTVVWIFVCIYFVNLIGIHYNLTNSGFYCRVLSKVTAIGLLIGTAFWLKRGIEGAVSRKGSDIHGRLMLLVDRILTIAVLLISFSFILQMFGVDITSILALGGVGIAILGFAAKDIVSNFCSGFYFHVTTPFMVGDHVLVVDKNIEGYIQEIGWFWVVVQDKQKGMAYFPHTSFSNDVVILLSSPSKEIKLDSK